jgi:glycosyltransferase involved in cell wall biosynthesis
MSPESAIADVMLQAVPHLDQDWDVEVWCPTEPEYRPCPVPVRPYREADSAVIEDLAAFDLVIYVLGNSPWHSRILPLARALPGLVVLHDVAMTDMVRRTAVDTGELDKIARRIAAESSPAHAETFRTGHHPDGATGWLRFSAETPLVDYAIEGSLGVVVHSWWHAEQVAGRTLGEVTVAPLPVPSARLGFERNESATADRLLHELPADAVLLVTVGAANANRRIDALLEALADGSALSDRVHLWAVGPCEARYAKELRTEARRLGVEGRFSITGAVSDSLLQDVLARADIAAALREPVLEGQSASVFTQMLAGVPVVVYDQAHYAELPDDAATKVDPAGGVASLRDALHALVANPADRKHRGELGRDYILATRSGEGYADALREAGDRALAARPMVNLTADLATRVRVRALSSSPVAIDLVADLAFELFDLQ